VSDTSPRFEVDHNVYILGAGFSVDASMPTLATFLNRMRDSTSWLESTGAHRELDAVKSVLAFRRRAAGAAYRVNVNVDNIEELFSLASARPEQDLVEAVPLAICATLRFCEATSGSRPRHRVGWRDQGAEEGWLTPVKWKTATAHAPTVADFRYDLTSHDWYAGVISGRLTRGTQTARNSVITFNYDTELERGLDSFGDVGYRYGIEGEANVECEYPQPADPVRALSILKIHGSMNWGIDNTGDRVVIRPSYEDLRSREDLVPLILPPTWQKQFAGHLQRVWQMAIAALETATRIIVVGFSVPATDSHFKYLLAAGLQENISLRQLVFVNPDSRTPRARLLRLLRPYAMNSGTIVPVQTDAHNFFFDAEWLQKIGRARAEVNIPITQP